MCALAGGLRRNIEACLWVYIRHMDAGATPLRLAVCAVDQLTACRGWVHNNPVGRTRCIMVVAP